MYLCGWWLSWPHEVMNAISAAMIECCFIIPYLDEHECMMIMSHDAYIITHKWLKSLSWMIRAESVNFYFLVFGNFEKFLLEFLEKCAISSMQYFLKDFIFIFAFWWNKKDWKIIVFFFSFFSLRQISLVGKSSFQNLNNKCFFFVISCHQISKRNFKISIFYIKF